MFPLMPSVGLVKVKAPPAVGVHFHRFVVARLKLRSLSVVRVPSCVAVKVWVFVTPAKSVPAVAAERLVPSPLTIPVGITTDPGAFPTYDIFDFLYLASANLPHTSAIAIPT